MLPPAASGLDRDVFSGIGAPSVTAASVNVYLPEMSGGTRPSELRRLFTTSMRAFASPTV